MNEDQREMRAKEGQKAGGDVIKIEREWERKAATKTVKKKKKNEVGQRRKLKQGQMTSDKSDSISS